MLAAVSAQAASAATVTVISTDNKQETYVIGDLAPTFDVPNVSYLGEGNVSGISVNKLFTLAKFTEAYGAVEVSADGNPGVRLTRAEVESVTSLVPVIYETGGQAAFLSPKLTGGSITVRQIPGPSVTGKPSKTKAKVRESISFKASMANPEPGKKYTYKWVFSGGGTATGPTAKHAWKKDGPQTATLTATVEGADTSIPAPIIKVAVGKLKESNKKREGGGTNQNAAAPTAGSTNGDSGAGQVSNSDATKSTKKKTKKKKAEQTDQDLERVTGELMSATVTPITPQSTLAARSGQQVVPDTESFGMTPTQVAFSIGFLLLIGGVLIELGIPQAFHRYLHDH